MNIAAVQLETVWEDRPANYARVRRLVDAARVPAGGLIVLPEMFDVGFSMNTAATDPGEPSPSEAFCRRLAGDTGAAVLAGVVSRTAGGRLANEAIAVSPDGVVLARYRKMQLFTVAGEHDHYAAGDAQRLFEWQGMRIAPFICYDLRFPELFRPAAQAGADLIVVVANWPARRSEHWVRLLQARAIENQCYVLGVNRCGNDPGLAYDGRSSLFDPLGVARFEAGPAEQVLTEEIDAAAVRSWRDQFPALRNARTR